MREADLKFEEVGIDMRQPQWWFNLAKITDITPSSTVPALLVENSIIYDLLSIMEFANEIGSQRLLPASVAHCGEARSLLVWQHSGISSDEKASSESLYKYWEKTTIS